MYIAVLGRQPELSLAEISAQFSNGRQISGKIAEFWLPRGEELDFLRRTTALTATGEPNIDRFGGVLKFARRLEMTPRNYLLSLPEGKITLGVSDYSKRASAHRAQGEALRLKQALKKQGRSVRVLPNKAPEIASAVACHEKLGRKPLRVELILIEKNWFVSVGAQDIEAYARRDQARPARDAKVGMLPPKLAQILINLCGPLQSGGRVLDPFCGTGVVLQEARLMGYRGYGTDLSERIVGFAERNLEWQTGVNRTDVRDETMNNLPDFELAVGDATTFAWKQPVDAVAAEIYLGPPMSQTPMEIKLKTVKQECGAVLKGFLKNLAGQIEVGTPVVLAVPAWLRPDGSYSRLGVDVTELGYRMVSFEVLDKKPGISTGKPLDENSEKRYNESNKLGFSELLYVRPGQIVAREIIVLRKN